MNDPSCEDLEVRETFKVASEFAPHITVTEEAFFAHGWQPLTITVLQSLWFLPADATFDIPFLVDWYARLGWKGANGKPLGANVVRREIGLIRDAGYITVTRLRGESGQAVGIKYAVSQRRTDQPQDGTWIPVLPGTEQIRRSHHMPPLATRGDSPHVANGGKTSSDHMPPMTTCGQSPHVADGAKQQVAPRGTNAGSPPHPPEEVDTSSPYPLTHTRSGVPSPREEEAEFAPEDIQTAERFLQELKDPWTAGRQTARKCAPLLLRVLAEQGWPAVRELDDVARRLLAREVTKNPEKISRYSQVLPNRIADLPLYEVVARRSRPHVPSRSGVDVLNEERTPTKRSMTELLEQMNKHCP